MKAPKRLPLESHRDLRSDLGEASDVGRELSSASLARASGRDVSDAPACTSARDSTEVCSSLAPQPSRIFAKMISASRPSTLARSLTSSSPASSKAVANLPP